MSNLFVWAALPNNIGSTNGANLGQDYLFYLTNGRWEDFAEKFYYTIYK